MKYIFVIVLCFFFFFQAEDGIRDLTVTGVQTCALPILNFILGLIWSVLPALAVKPTRSQSVSPAQLQAVIRSRSVATTDGMTGIWLQKIGRASCRGRV